MRIIEEKLILNKFKHFYNEKFYLIKIATNIFRIVFCLRQSLNVKKKTMPYFYFTEVLNNFVTILAFFEHIQILFNHVQQFLIGIFIRSYIKRLETSLTLVLLNSQTHSRT